MTVLVAYSADVYGEAALDHGIAEATASGQRLASSQSPVAPYSW